MRAGLKPLIFMALTIMRFATTPDVSSRPMRKYASWWLPYTTISPFLRLPATSP